MGKYGKQKPVNTQPLRGVAKPAPAVKPAQPPPAPEPLQPAVPPSGPSHPNVGNPGVRKT